MLALWIGLEVYNKGVAGALGGVFSGASAREDAAGPTPGERVRRRVSGAQAEADARRERLLED